MGWKKLPYWLKGGIILSVIDAFLILFVILTSSPKEATIMGLGFLHIPLVYLIAPLNLQTLFENILIWVIFGILSWFIIGAVIGWIYGKIKGNLKNK